MTPTRTKHLFALAGMATLAMLQPAMALDAQSFVDRVEAIYEPLGYELSPISTPILPPIRWAT
ncbi:MAG: hypothetical protein K0R85_1938 [Devosia sp.]|nr:hypothetical protein [Devosia sp.]